MNIKKTVLVAVTNDISTDQRVHKVSNYLIEKGFDVIVYGRLLSNTFDVSRLYKIVRKKHWFNNNFLFYAEYNIRLLAFLIKNKSNYILSNDLDTLPACYLACKIQKNELIFDSHEFFTEVPELQERRFVQNFWKTIEKIILPNVKRAYTVSNGIAKAYFERYGIKMSVIRNVPYLKIKYKNEVVNFPTNNKVLLYQGVLSEKRGLKQVIKSLDYLKDVDLVIIGFGKEKENLIKFTESANLKDRVHFLGRIPFDKLHNYTKLADIGLILEEPIGHSFQFSLPNKLFDYIHSELPILASPLIEIKSIVEKNKIGLFIESHEPKHIANKVQNLLDTPKLIHQIKKNQKKIKPNYCWEEEQKLLDIFFN